MKMLNETKVKRYVFTKDELKKILKVEGEIKKIELNDDEFIIETFEEKTTKDVTFNSVLSNIGNMRFGG